MTYGTKPKGPVGRALRVHEHYPSVKGRRVRKRKHENGSFSWQHSRDGGQEWDDGLPPGVTVEDVGLYYGDELQKADPAETVFLAEGERDAETLTKLGLLATSTPHGALAQAGKEWRPLYSSVLRKRDDVVIVPDTDEAGRAHALKCAFALRGLVPSVKVLDLSAGLPPGGKDLTDWFAAGHPVEEFLALAEATPQWEPPPWPEPQPPSRAASALPEFPVGALTPWLEKFVSGLATETQTPLGLVAPVVLAVVATSVQRTVVVYVRRGWREPLSFYTVSALESGGRKSAVFSRATKPLEVREEELAADMAGRIAEAETEAVILKKELDRKQGKASQEEDRAERSRLFAEAKLLARELAEKPVPKAPRLIVGDVTPEKLGRLLAENDGRLGAFSDEGTLLKVLAGLYKDGKGSPNLDVLLKGHAGTTLRYDRQNGDPVIVHNPALALGLLVQPKIVRDVAANEHFRGEGFTARVAWSLPKTTVGTRDADAPPMEEKVGLAYDQNILALARLAPLRDETGVSLAYVLQVDDKARAVLVAFMNGLEPRLGSSGDLSSITDWACKAAGLAVRLAALLHLCDCVGASDLFATVPTTPIPATLPIPASTMLRALSLVEDYFLPHAQAAYDLMGASAEVALANRTVATIVRLGWREPFSRKSAYDAPNVKKDEWNKVASLLADNDCLRELGKQETGGRPGGPFYAPNPRLFDTPWARELAQ